MQEARESNTTQIAFVDRALVFVVLGVVWLMLDRIGDRFGLFGHRSFESSLRGCVIFATLISFFLPLFADAARNIRSSRRKSRRAICCSRRWIGPIRGLWNCRKWMRDRTGRR